MNTIKSLFENNVFITLFMQGFNHHYSYGTSLNVWHRIKESLVCKYGSMLA